MMLEEIRNVEKFKQIVKEKIHRKGIDSLMSWLDTTDFYTAPSSTRYHGAEHGGLVKHSLVVYECLSKMAEDESEETIAIVALFHDLCKVNFYKESTRNTKDESGKWIQVPYYETNETSACLGHGEKSMYLIMKHMDLTEEEACSIRWHMSFSAVEPLFEKPSMTKAMQMHKLVLKLQTADSQAAFWYNS